MTPRARHRLAPVLGTLGLVLGLSLAEAAFRMRDGGAFPGINVFERDELRGVRLQPDSETRVGSRTERVIRVRINADGYRGAAWPAPSAGEVVVVGDGLSFGLGVEEDEALPARLHAALAARPVVIDASVPTYGPPEYLLTMEPILMKRRPAAAVLVVDLRDDLEEIELPNQARHTAVNGWASPMPEGGPPARSPIRAAVIQRSHAAFALWRWQRGDDDTAALAAPLRGAGALVALAAARDRAVVAFDDAAREMVSEGRWLAQPMPPPLPLEAMIASAHALTEAARARLVVALVPLDAQVSPDAQARRGLSDAQVASLDRLVLDLATRARLHGATVVDPSEALRQPMAPAYLPDGHLSAVGHEVVARRVARAMDAHPDGV